MMREPTSGRLLITVALLVALGGTHLFAHELIVKGTVVTVQKSRIQVKTGEEKPGQIPAWYPIDAKTKILRGKKSVTLSEAKITTGEKIVVLLDHDAKNVMKTLELRLPAR